VGFNVVTTSERTSAQNFGLDGMPSHADRYAMAAEFLDAVNGLWDGWEEGAMVQDLATNTYVDASKVHALEHAGEYFRVRGPLNSPRSPQGRPLIAQAGGSDRGRAFASKYADLILAGAYGGPDEMKAFREDVRERVRGHGRNPDDVRVMFLVAVHFSDRPDATVSDLTSDAKFEALVVQNGSELDLDLSRFDPDGPFPMDLEPGGHTSVYDGMKLLGAKGMTFREVISTVGVGGEWQPIGTPEAIADELIEVMEHIGGDGVMLLANDVGDDAFITNVTERLAPALQRAGAMQTAYSPGTLRDKLLSF
jgi:alkanesulfonate monooxygenase SsuD/methylene tetrahydromethanopterin reductase-like flavin-dependent oxidoreductase (luciferase family)